jgi:hypothetical protein
MNAEIIELILSDEEFTQALDAISVLALQEDLPRIEPVLSPARVEWSHALLCASALAAASTEPALDAALRVAQGCFLTGYATDSHRRAAAVLLERMGNQRAVELAEARGLLGAEAWAEAPGPLQLDVVRRRLELTIPLAAGELLSANPFQREFWTSAGDHRWLSVSAPTSAGKSYIVKRWFQERAGEAERFRGVYLVPTRALIDEISRDLRRDFGADVAVFVLPWDQGIGKHAKEVFVLTQERLHLLQEQDPAFAPDLLFVDEAQKFGDDTRGVLLQSVLDESTRRRPDAQVLFASPSSLNPEMLLEGAPNPTRAAALVSEGVTVNQSLLWVDPARDGRWSVELIVGGEPRHVGAVALSTGIRKRQRLPRVAVALGADTTGNVVYVNGAADAEHAAEVIAKSLEGRVDLSEDEDIVTLRELIGKAIHRDYRLRPVLEQGVAFHYGNMPLIVRAEIERLFRAEKIRYLVCTSTLLEGVNLPCRNLFARGPQRGNHKPMTLPDFWNLAGRAGRWGKEFRGNVVCVDTRDGGWEVLPRRRQRQRLERSSNEVLSRPAALRAFIESAQPAEAARQEPLSAAVFSMLATRVSQGRPLSSIPGIELTAEHAADLEERIRGVLAPVEIPPALMARHAGISPTAMQVLLEYFRRHQDPVWLPLRRPGTTDAWLSYTKALSRSRDYLGTARFGDDKRCAMLGALVHNWMRGFPLARIIEERMRYVREERADLTYDQDAIIRGTMDDVEQVARFAAPKYLACYHDVLALHLAEQGAEPQLTTEALTMMLELGVSRPTAVSLMGLGLSRTSAIALSELVEATDLTPEQALAWLRERQGRPLDVAALVQREVDELL